MLAMICWRMNGVDGHGSPISWVDAYSWAKAMNDMYGEGTHWVEACKTHA